MDENASQQADSESDWGSFDGLCNVPDGAADVFTLSVLLRTFPNE